MTIKYSINNPKRKNANKCMYILQFVKAKFDFFFLASIICLRVLCVARLFECLIYERKIYCKVQKNEI